MSQQFTIRCDASPEIGVGHFMRTYCLARALRQHHSVCFLMAQATPLVESMLRDEQIPLVHLSTDGKPMAGEIEIAVAQRTRHAAKRRTIIVDHYGATPDYLLRLRNLAHAVGVVDDLADRDLSAADWVLNQNLGAEELPYRVRPDCRRLMGTAFCLLRPQFAEARRGLRRSFSANDNRVLITLGGGATTPIVARIIAALACVSRQLTLRIIMTSECRLDSARHNLEILHNVTNMAEQMAWADLSINAGGSTTWELCSLGVPMIVVPLSHDQVLNAALVEKAGCAIRLLPEAIHGRLGSLVEDCLAAPQRREAMSAKGQALVDGLGANRAAQSLDEMICA